MGLGKGTGGGARALGAEPGGAPREDDEAAVWYCPGGPTLVLDQTPAGGSPAWRVLLLLGLLLLGLLSG